MLTPTTIKLADDGPSDKIPPGSSWRKLMRKLLVSALLITVVGLADASKGGGGEKKKDNSFKDDFTPIRTTGSFTLKAGPSLTANYNLGTEKTSKYVSFNTLITYQKGNSIYVMPYHYKISTSMYLDNSNNNNLRLLDLRVNLGNHK